MDFTAKADYSEVDKLIQKIDVLEKRLKSMDVSSNAADVKRLTQELSAARGQMDELASAAANSSQKMVQWAAGLAGIFSTTQLAQQVFQIRSQFQDLEAGFKVMLGSGEKAKKLLSDVTDFAAKTPFDLMGVASGTQQLLAYGTKAEEVTGILRQLGDIAAGLNIPLNQLIYLYGTTIAQGRMYTMDLRQFQNRGIPMAKELANVMGVTEKEVAGLVTAGKVTNKEFTAAIQNMSKEGGRFGGLMDARSKTLSGQWANIQDTIDQAFNQMGESTEGFFNSLLQGTAWAVDHWRELGTAIAGAAAAVGGYKAALMAVNAVNKINQRGAEIRAGKRAKDGVSDAVGGTTKKPTYKEAFKAEGERVFGSGRAKTNEQIAATEKQITAERSKALALSEKDAASRVKLLQVDKANSPSGSLDDIDAKVRKAETELDILEKTGASKDVIAAKEEELLSLYDMQYQKQDELLQKTQELTAAGEEYRDVLSEQVEANAPEEADTSAEEAKAEASEQAAAATEVLTAAEEANTAAEEINSAAEGANTAAKEGNTIATQTNATATAAGTTSAEANTIAEGANTTSTEANSVAQKANTISKEGNTISTKANTVAAETDAVAQKGDTVSKEGNTLATNALAVAMDKLKVAYATNPIGMWIAGLTLAVTAIMELCMWLNNEEEAIEKAKNAFNNTMSDYETKIRAATGMLSIAQSGTDDYKKAMEQLNSICRELGVAEYDLNKTYEAQIGITENLEAAVRKLAAARAMEEYAKVAAESENEEMQNVYESIMHYITDGKHGITPAELTAEQEANIKLLAAKAVEAYRKGIRAGNPEKATADLMKGWQDLKKYVESQGLKVGTVVKPFGYDKTELEKDKTRIDKFFGDISEMVEKHEEGLKGAEAQGKAMSDAAVDTGKATTKAMENMSAEELIEGYKSAQAEMANTKESAEKAGESVDKLGNKEVNVKTDNSQIDETKDKIDEIPTRIELANDVTMTIPTDDTNILETEFQLGNVSYKIAENNGKMMVVRTNDGQILGTQESLNIVGKIITALNGSTLSPNVDTSVISRLRELAQEYIKLGAAQEAVGGDSNLFSKFTGVLSKFSGFFTGGGSKGGSRGVNPKEVDTKGGNKGTNKSNATAKLKEQMLKKIQQSNTADLSAFENAAKEGYEQAVIAGDKQAQKDWLEVHREAQKRKQKLSIPSNNKTPKPKTPKKKTEKKTEKKTKPTTQKDEITQANYKKKVDTFLNKKIEAMFDNELEELDKNLDDISKFYASDVKNNVNGAEEKLKKIEKKREDIKGQLAAIQRILNGDDISFENEKLSNEFWGEKYADYIKDLKKKKRKQDIETLKGIQKDIEEIKLETAEADEELEEELRSLAEELYKVKQEEWLNQNDGYKESDYVASLTKQYKDENPLMFAAATSFEKIQNSWLKKNNTENPEKFRRYFKEYIVKYDSDLYKSMVEGIAKELGGGEDALAKARKFLAENYLGEKLQTPSQMVYEYMISAYTNDLRSEMPDDVRVARTKAINKVIDDYLNGVGDLKGKINSLTKDKDLNLENLVYLKGEYEKKLKTGTEEDKAIYQNHVDWIDQLIKFVNKEYNEAVEDANFEDVKKKFKFDELFDDFDDATLAQLEKIKTTLVNMFNSAGLSANAYKEILEKIKETEDAITERKKTGLQTMLEEAFPKRTERKNLQKQIEDYNKQIDELLDKKGDDASVNKDIDNKVAAVAQKRDKLQGKLDKILGKGTFGKIDEVSEQYQVINQNLQSMPDLLRNLGVHEESDFFKGTEKLAEASQASMDAVQNLMSLNIVGALSDVVKMYSSLAESIGSYFGLDADYDQYNKMLEEYERLNAVWQQIIDRKREYLSISYGEEARRVGEEAQSVLDTSVEAARKLGKAYLNAGAGVGSHSIGVRLRKEMDAEDIANAIAAVGAEAVSGRMTGLFDLTREELERLQDMAPAFWSKLDDKTKEYLQTIIDGAKTAEDILDATMERINGISFDSLSDNFFSTLMDMKSGANTFMNNFEEMMKRAVLQEAYQRTIAPELEKWYKRWYERMQDGLTAGEQAVAEAEYRMLVQQGIAMRDNLQKTMGWNVSSSQNGSSGGFGSMSQDTADVMNGRLAAIQIAVQSVLSTMNTAHADDTMMGLKVDALLMQAGSMRDIASEMRDYQVRSFLELQGINENTGNTVSQLGMINKTMADIYDKVKSI